MKYLPLLLAEPDAQEDPNPADHRVVRWWRSSSSGCSPWIRGGFNQGIDVAGADRLVVIGARSRHAAAADLLHGAHAAIARRQARHARQLVRRRLPGRAELLPAVRDGPRN